MDAGPVPQLLKIAGVTGAARPKASYISVRLEPAAIFGGAQRT